MSTSSTSLTIEAPDGLPFIEIQREFDYPVEAVFAAHKDPEQVCQWLGPRGYTMDLPTYDFVTGGSYRFIHHDGQGGAFAFHGVFHVVRDNEFVIQTFEFEGVPDVVSIESMTFERLPDNRTRLVGRSVYPSIEARDSMISSGMERGVREGYEQLEELLKN